MTILKTFDLSNTPCLHHFVLAEAGLIYEIKREDGYPFGGTRLDIKYHNA